MRDPKRIDEICEQIKVAWYKHPDERLGQFLMNAAWFCYYPEDKHVFFNIEDDEWAKILEHERYYEAWM